MKIPPVRAEFFCADRQTDVTKLIVTFHDFVNTPEGAIEKKVIAEINEFNCLGFSVS
jgi:hypothetical protein